MASSRGAACATAGATECRVFLIEPFSLAVNLLTHAVDKKMQWLRTAKPLEKDCQATTATAPGSYDRGWRYRPRADRRSEQKDLRSDAAPGGTPVRSAEAGLDGDRRIDWLAAPLSGRRRMPCRHRLRGEPNRQASSSNRHGIVFRPVRHPVRRLGKRVATATSVNLLGMSFLQSAGVGSAGLSYGQRRLARHPSGIDRGANGRNFAVRSGASCNLRSIHAPRRNRVGSD